MKFWGYILVFLLFIGSFFAGRWTKSPYERIVERRDTVIIRDTMTEYIPVPKYITYIRTDTCYLPALADSGHSPVLVPIERKIYQTPDYRAVIEGYQASLLEIQVYPQKMVVTPKKPTSKSRWGIGIQAGVGLVPTTGKLSPYIGIGVQYSLFSF